MNVTEIAPRYLFFTGKGGVGKISISCATAIALADKGRMERAGKGVIMTMGKGGVGKTSVLSNFCCLPGRAGGSPFLG